MADLDSFEPFWTVLVSFANFPPNADPNVAQRHGVLPLTLELHTASDPKFENKL